MEKRKKKVAQAGLFTQFAKATSIATGRSWSFGLAMTVIVVWAATGPLFHYSDTWQLVINTGTTIVTFLMVFLIQNTQNRDAQAMQVKLDELLRATRGAHTAVMDIEELTDEELSEIKRAYGELALIGRKTLRSGRSDTGTPDLVTSAFRRKEDEE